MKNGQRTTRGKDEVRLTGQREWRDSGEGRNELLLQSYAPNVVAKFLSSSANDVAVIASTTVAVVVVAGEAREKLGMISGGPLETLSRPGYGCAKGSCADSSC